MLPTMFKTRSTKPERIDTGDYTLAEYEQFLEDIAFINRFTGDERVLKKTLLTEIEQSDLRKFSVLDVGAGSGELLRTIAKFARKRNIKIELYGLELNEISAKAILDESKDFDEINSIRGDALELPFADNSFDFVISSLFTHHLSDEQIVQTLREMNRVASRQIFVIDLHRHPVAFAFYKIFCVVFNMSQMVREDGSLSILRSFKPVELRLLAEKAEMKNVSVTRHFPFRIVLNGKKF